MLHNETIDLLLAHTTIREYEDRAVSPEVVDTILKCAQRAPTSSYLQAYSVIQVTDPAKRQALMDFSEGQEWLVKAPLVLLFCADLYRVHKLVQPKDAHVLHNAELFTVAVSDAALMAQRAFIAAQACGLGGVVVGGVRNHTAEMAEAFGMPELVFPLYALCLGYPAAVPARQRPRLDTRFICGVDRYPALPNEEELAAYDHEVGQYFFHTTNGRSSRGWTARAGHAIDTKPRYDVADYLEKAGFMTKTEPAG